MNPTAYQGLALEEQARLIFHEGNFISKITFFQLSISLYRVNHEFVEIWYNTSTGTIRKIEPLREWTISPFVKHLYKMNLN